MENKEAEEEEEMKAPSNSTEQSEVNQKALRRSTIERFNDNRQRYEEKLPQTRFAKFFSILQFLSFCFLFSFASAFVMALFAAVDQKGNRIRAEFGCVIIAHQTVR